MKQFILFFVLCPLLSAAQSKNHRFENDTLYTSSGFKIYAGQTLQFGKAASFKGFRYITINNGVSVSSVENNSIVVKELSNYGVSILGFTYIDITGSIVYRDGSKGIIMVTMAFEQAIGSRVPGTTSELILPEEYQFTKEKAAEFYMPAFVADTLYTSCGYKIFKGQLLQFGNPIGTRGRFRYVNIKNRVPADKLKNNHVRVTELKDFAISAVGNGYITVIGTLIINNIEQGDIEMHIAFDHAVGDSPAVAGELLVPDEFRSRIKNNPQAEMEK